MFASSMADLAPLRTPTLFVHGGRSVWVCYFVPAGGLVLGAYLELWAQSLENVMAMEAIEDFSAFCPRMREEDLRPRLLL